MLEARAKVGDFLFSQKIGDVETRPLNENMKDSYLGEWEKDTNVR